MASRSGSAAHTEFSRALSEHGIFGLLSLVVLASLVVGLYLRAPSVLTRGWVAAFSVWSFAAMTHSAMRISAIALMLGIASIVWRRHGEPPGLPSHAEPRRQRRRRPRYRLR